MATDVKLPLCLLSLARRSGLPQTFCTRRTSLSACSFSLLVWFFSERYIFTIQGNLLHSCGIVCVK